MDSDPIYRFPASPGTPLFPVSPERENRKYPAPSQLPPSPSMMPSSISPSRTILHHENSPSANPQYTSTSSVQGKVAQFNHLTKEAAQRRKDSEAALKRAVMGREEAENESRRLRETNDALRREVEEGRGRERRVGERLESVMEDLQRTKGSQGNAQAVYEKEVRRARKEAFKSSSALVNLQEELKTARNRFTLMRVEAEEQRGRVEEQKAQIVHHQGEIEEQRGQITSMVEENFLTQRDLTIAREEGARLKMQLEIVEAEKEALKSSMEEQEIARAAAEGAVALPPSRDGNDLEQPAAEAGDMLIATRDEEPQEKIAMGDAPQDATTILAEELQWERRLRQRADELAHFMQMECRFRCCSCRMASITGAHIIDYSSADEKDPAAIEGMEQKANQNEEQPISSIFSQPETEGIIPEPILPSPEGHIPSQHHHQTEPTSPVHEIYQDYTDPSLTATILKHPPLMRQISNSSYSPANVRDVSDDRHEVQRPKLNTRQTSELTSNGSHKADAGNESFPIIDHLFSFSAPDMPPMIPPTTLPPLPATTQPLSPRMQTDDFNFTEIIPSLPPLHRPLPDPPSSTTTTTTANATPIPPTATSTPPPLSPRPNMTTTQTTITTIPLKEDDPVLPATPGTIINREQALEQIRARRGRARSFAATAHSGSANAAGTPKRGMMMGTPRREISAPACRGV